MNKQDEVRFWEAIVIEKHSDSTRDIVDKCGHAHDTLAEAREWHRMHPHYTHIVYIDWAEDDVNIVREVKHTPKRPRSGFDAFVFDQVNGG